MSRGDVPTIRVPLGDCDCPGTPHKADWADCRVRYNFGGLRAIAGALQRQFFEPTLYKLIAVERGVAAWNLVRLDERNQPVPLEITVATLDGLDPDQARILVDHFDNETTLAQLRNAGLLPDEEAEAGPPNPSGEPSPAGSEETLAQTTTPLPGEPTTLASTSSELPSTSSARSSRRTSPTSS
jgi:hypothetical protein